MQNLILDTIAQPRRPVNMLWNSVHSYISHAQIRWNGDISCSAAQRNNLYMLMDQALAFGIEGDIVELGCHVGHTAVVIASVLDHHGSEQKFHVYDNFGYDLNGKHDVRDRLARNFTKHKLPLPIVHEGDFADTLPDELPQRIAFVHIDCGMGDVPERHCSHMIDCLQAVYPRMSKGAIGVLMDYHDPQRTVGGWDCNPGVKMACDHFFRNKPEIIQILYGDHLSHAFFRKVW